MSDDGRYFDEGDVKAGKREFDFKGREGQGPDDWDDDIDIMRSRGFVSVSLSGRSALSRAETLLSGIPDGLEKAVRSATARMQSHLRSFSTKAAAERYAVTSKTIRQEENVSVSYTFSGGVQVMIEFSGYKIPLYRFSGASPKTPTKDMSRRIGVLINSRLDAKTGDDMFNWKLLHPSIPASGHALKSTSPYKFDRAFVAHFKSGHTGIFERTGDTSKADREEIQELYGPSVPQMLGNDEVANKVIDDSMEYFDKRMEHEISRILNGIGG